MHAKLVVKSDVMQCTSGVQESRLKGSVCHNSQLICLGFMQRLYVDVANVNDVVCTANAACGSVHTVDIVSRQQCSCRKGDGAFGWQKSCMWQCMYALTCLCAGQCS